MRGSCNNSTNVTEEPVVERVRDMLITELLKPDTLAEAMRSLSSEAKARRFEDRSTLHGLQKRLKAIEAKERRLVDVLATDSAPRDPISRSLKELEAERNELLGRIETLEGDIEAHGAAIVGEPAVRAFSDSVRSMIASANGPALAAVFKLLRLRIVIHPDRVDVSISPDTPSEAPDEHHGGDGPPFESGGPSRVVSFEPVSRHRFSEGPLIERVFGVNGRNVSRSGRSPIREIVVGGGASSDNSGCGQRLVPGIQWT